MKRCLVVVDYQNDFVQGVLGFPQAVEMEGLICEKITQYRQNADEVLFTVDTHGEDYLDKQEGQYLPIAHCVLGTPGHALFGRVADMMQPSDRRFIKHTFGSDELYMYLKETPFQSIELVGVVSNICVISNAILAKTAQPETPILVDARCVASNDQSLNEAALDVMMGLQIKVLNR